MIDQSGLDVADLIPWSARAIVIDEPHSNSGPSCYSEFSTGATYFSALITTAF